jgi:hypothetical protein
MHAQVQVAVLLTRIQSTGNPGSGKKSRPHWKRVHIRKRLLLELASERATSRWQILLKDPTTSTKRLIKPPPPAEVGRNLRLIRAIFFKRAGKETSLGGPIQNTGAERDRLSCEADDGRTDTADLNSQCPMK